MTWIVVAVGLGLIGLERARPARPLPAQRRWWAWAIALNVGQLGAVVLGGYTWNQWLGAGSLFELGDLSPWAGGAVAYLVSTFVYYWWHRARHESPWLWRLTHQVHHSVQRIEVIASFYKHPVEQIANGVLTATITFALLGVSVEAAAVNTLLCGVAEFFYHLNVRTPRWLGWIIQRPEMHRVHHERDRHTSNYADLPMWDLLFGTFDNPAAAREVACGFDDARAGLLWSMLAFRDVHAEPRPAGPVGRRVAVGALLALGLSHMGLTALSPWAPEVARAGGGALRMTVAAPHPKVFTRVGAHEPFAFAFTLQGTYVDGAHETVALDGERYARLPGPYMYRNVFGAMLAFSPILDAPLVDGVLRRGLCERGDLAAVFSRSTALRSVTVQVRARGVGPTPDPVTVTCATTGGGAA